MSPLLDSILSRVPSGLVWLFDEARADAWAFGFDERQTVVEAFAAAAEPGIPPENVIVVGTLAAAAALEEKFGGDVCLAFLVEAKALKFESDAGRAGMLGRRFRLTEATAAAFEKVKDGPIS